MQSPASSPMPSYIPNISFLRSSINELRRPSHARLKRQPTSAASLDGKLTLAKLHEKDRHHNKGNSSSPAVFTVGYDSAREDQSLEAKRYHDGRRQNKRN